MTDEPREEGAQAESGAVVEEPAAAAATGEAAEQPPKLHQDVAIRDVGPCKKHITVTIHRDSLDELFNDKFKEIVVEGNVAGFRPGKAPRKVIEKRYYKEVAEQVRTEVLLASLEQLADDHDLAPLSPPNIDPNKIELPKEGPFVYEFDVEV